MLVAASDRTSPWHLGVFLAVGLLALALSGQVWARRGRTPGWGALILLLLATAQVLVAYGMSYAAIAPAAAVWWMDATYAGWLVAPAALMLLVARITGHGPVPAWAVAALAVEPLLMAALIWSPAGRDAFFAGGRDPATFDFEATGVAYWAFLAYANLLLAASTAMIIMAARSSAALRGRQAALIVSLVLLPWLVSFASVVNAKVVGADPTVVTLALTVAFVYALSRYRMLDLGPLIARAQRRSGGGIVVIDESGRIVDIDAEAARLLGSGLTPAMGLRIEDVWASRPDLVAALTGATGPGAPGRGRAGSRRAAGSGVAVGSDLVLPGLGPDRAAIRLVRSPLLGPRGDDLGTLVLVQEADAAESGTR